MARTSFTDLREQVQTWLEAQPSAVVAEMGENIALSIRTIKESVQAEKWPSEPTLRNWLNDMLPGHKKPAAKSTSVGSKAVSAKAPAPEKKPATDAVRAPRKLSTAAPLQVAAPRENVSLATSAPLLEVARRSIREDFVAYVARLRRYAVELGVDADKLRELVEMGVEQ